MCHMDRLVFRIRQVLKFNSLLLVTLSYISLHLKPNNHAFRNFISGGSKLYAPAQTYGTMCIDLIPPQVSGIAFTWGLYSSTANTNQYSIETTWYYTLMKNKQVMMNLWGASNVNLIPNNIVKVPNSINARYCIEWQVGGYASWYIDGKLILTQSLEIFTDPLIPTLTIWGDITIPYFLTIGGSFVASNSIPTASVKNAYLSENPLDNGPVTIEPTLNPNLVPTFEPTVPTVSPSSKPSKLTSHPAVSRKPTFKPTKLTDDLIWTQRPSPKAGSASETSSSNSSYGPGVYIIIFAAAGSIAIIFAVVAACIFCRNTQARILCKDIETSDVKAGTHTDTTTRLTHGMRTVELSLEQLNEEALAAKQREKSRRGSAVPSRFFENTCQDGTTRRASLKAQEANY